MKTIKLWMLKSLYVLVGIALTGVGGLCIGKGFGMPNSYAAGICFSAGALAWFAGVLCFILTYDGKSKP